MKRFISIILVALLLALPAVAEAFSPFDYVQGQTVNGKYLVYSFPDIALYLPMEWEGAITVEQSETGVTFSQTASKEGFLKDGLEGGGFLFALCASEDKSYEELPAYEELGRSENTGLYFYLMLPSDYRAYAKDEAVRAEYDQMHSQIGIVVEMARIAPSLFFYPGESTDAGMS